MSEFKFKFEIGEEVKMYTGHERAIVLGRCLLESSVGLDEVYHIGFAVMGQPHRSFMDVLELVKIIKIK